MVNHISASRGQPAADPKYRVFVIDSGWHSSLRQMILDNLDVFREYLRERDHSVYVLSQDQSKALLHQNPHYIRADPCLMVLRAGGESDDTPHGVCLNLGHAKSEKQVVLLMRWLCQILCTRLAAGRLSEVVRRTAHKEGVSGTLEIIADSVSQLGAE